MGHCACREGWTCPWCRTAVVFAEDEHSPQTPVGAWDINAETAGLYSGGGW